MKKQCKHLAPFHRSLKSSKLQGIRCETCPTRSPYVWICLAQHCTRTFCELNKFIHMKEHLTQNHFVFINPFNSQIICLQCKIQLLDWQMLTQKPSYIDPSPYRNCFSQKEDSRTEEEALPQAHRKSNKGLTLLKDQANSQHLNSVLYLLFHLKFFRKVARVESDFVSAKKDNVSNIAILFLKFNKLYWSAQFKFQSVLQLTKEIYKFRPSLCTYQKKDPFVSFKLLTSCLKAAFTLNKKSILGSLFKSLSQISYTCQMCELTFQNQFQLQYISIQLKRKDQRSFEDAAKIFKARGIPFSYKDSPRSGFFGLFSAKQDFPITLQELLLSSKKLELPLSCSKCKQQKVKLNEMQFLQNPNYLVVQVQRIFKSQYRNKRTPVLFPQLLELSSLFKAKAGSYRLSVALCLGQQQDSFLSLARHPKSNYFYQFSKHQAKLAKELSKYQCPTILIYEGVQSPPLSKLSNSISQQISLYNTGQLLIQPSRRTLLPVFWLQKLQSLAEPGQLTFNEQQCSHGFFRQNLFLASYRNKQYQLLDIEVLKTLIQKFGGRLPERLDSFNQCQDCLVVQRRLAKRRKTEKELILKFDNLPAQNKYLISQKWLNSWSAFLYSKEEPSELPGPINNQLLLTGGRLRSNIQTSDYRKVSYYVWLFLQKLYGGGPQIKIESRRSRKQQIISSDQVKLIGMYVQDLNGIMRQQCVSPIKRLGSGREEEQGPAVKCLREELLVSQYSLDSQDQN